MVDAVFDRVTINQKQMGGCHVFAACAFPSPPWSAWSPTG